jgi:hypothetical protein
VFGNYSVTAMEVAGTFSVLDTARSQQMSGVIMGLAMQKMGAATPAPVATPSGEAVTPAVTPEPTK